MSPIKPHRRRLRELAWAGGFLAILAAVLFPAILLAARYDHAMSVYEQIAVVACATIVVQHLRRKALWEVTGRLDWTWLRQLFAGFGLGAVLMLTPAALLWGLGLVQFNEANSSLGAIVNATLLMAAVAIAEELLFRGVLFQRLVAGLGAWPGQLAIASLFTLTHLGNPGMTGATKVLACINIFAASILFGLAFLRSRSLAMPIGIHFMANTMQGIVLGFGVSGSNEPRFLEPIFDPAPVLLTGGQFGLEGSLPGLFVLILLLVFFRRSNSANLPDH